MTVSEHRKLQKSCRKWLDCVITLFNTLILLLFLFRLLLYVHLRQHLVDTFIQSELTVLRLGALLKGPTMATWPPVYLILEHNCILAYRGNDSVIYSLVTPCL